MGILRNGASSNQVRKTPEEVRLVIERLSQESVSGLPMAIDVAEAANVDESEVIGKLRDLRSRLEVPVA